MRAAAVDTRDVNGSSAQSAAIGPRDMMWPRCLAAATLLLAATASREVFTNSFLVRFKRSVPHEAVSQLAQRHGFDNLGPVRPRDPT